MLRENLDALIAKAMKRRDNIALKVLRLIKSEYQKHETSGKKTSFLNDSIEIKLLKKLDNQWKDGISAFKAADRDTEELEAEVNYLETLLPKELSREEQVKKINEVMMEYLKDVPTEEKLSMRHLGFIIKEVSTKYPSIDNKLISEVYKGFQEFLKNNTD